MTGPAEGNDPLRIDHTAAWMMAFDNPALDPHRQAPKCDAGERLDRRAAAAETDWDRLVQALRLTAVAKQAIALDVTHRSHRTRDVLGRHAAGAYRHPC